MAEPETVFRVYLEQIDALKGMRLLGNQSMDIICTSPPYNLNRGYDIYSDDIPRDEYLRWMGRFFKEAKRILKCTGSLFFNFSTRPKDRYLSHELVLHANPHFDLQNEIHWIKSITVDGTTHGQFKPINSNRYLNCLHEYIWHFTPGGDVSLDRNSIGVKYKDVTNLRRWKIAHQHKAHCRGNVWFVPYETRQRAAVHPAMFPIAIPDMCLRLHGMPPPELRTELLVLDPFAGVCTTGVAAVQLGCKFLGFDISMEYLGMGGERIYHATGEKVLLKGYVPNTDIEHRGE